MLMNLHHVIYSRFHHNFRWIRSEWNMKRDFQAVQGCLQGIPMKSQAGKTGKVMEMIKDESGKEKKKREEDLEKRLMENLSDIKSLINNKSNQTMQSVNKIGKNMEGHKRKADDDEERSKKKVRFDDDGDIQMNSTMTKDEMMEMFQKMLEKERDRK